MKMNDNDLILVKQILNSWGEITEFSNEASYLTQDGGYVFITSGISSHCLQDLFLHGFVVSCKFCIGYSGSIEVRINKRNK